MKRIILVTMLIVGMVGLVFGAGSAESAKPTDAGVTEVSFWTFQDLHLAFYETHVLKCSA